MSRRKRKAIALQREREIMHSSVRVDGKGEDPALAAYLQQGGDASFSDMAEMSLALDRLLKGDMSMLNDPKQAHIVAKLRERAAAIQDAERRYNEDSEKFIDGLWEKAEKAKPRGAKLDETIARGTRQIQDARIMASANMATKKLRMQELISNGPKKRVFVTGNLVTTNNGPALEPDVINIMGFRMVLAPGEHDLPIPFAERYEQLQLTRQENQARSQLLSENLRADQLGIKWNQLTNSYKGILQHREHPQDALLDTPGVME